MQCLHKYSQMNQGKLNDIPPTVKTRGSEEVQENKKYITRHPGHCPAPFNETNPPGTTEREFAGVGADRRCLFRVSNTYVRCWQAPLFHNPCQKATGLPPPPPERAGPPNSFSTKAIDFQKRGKQGSWETIYRAGLFSLCGPGPQELPLAQFEPAAV